MQFKLIDNQKVFEPIDLQIKIESNDELLDLLARFAFGEQEIISRINKLNKVKQFEYKERFRTLFSELNRIAAERELKER